MPGACLASPFPYRRHLASASRTLPEGQGCGDALKRRLAAAPPPPRAPVCLPRRRFRLQRRRRVFGRLTAEQRREVGLLLLARRGLGAAHRALTLEDRALVDDQARGRDLADHLA